MKLKMRFEKDDMVKLGIYAIILFILICALASNLIYFAKHQSFTADLFIALGKDYFISTIIVFLVCFFGLIAAQKDKFFEFDKGFGFTTEKKLDGYSKWCDKKEMKSELKPVIAKAPKADAGGIPLINDGHTLWVDDGEYHNLVIGSTGSGKTQTIIFPMVHSLSKHGESMIITDPKGEIYEKTSEMLRKKGYDIVIINFRNPQKGNAWNPLSLPYHLWKEGNQDKAIELLDDLALNILYDETAKNNDPFWEKTSAAYFSGIVLGLFEDAEEEEININSVSLMTTVGEEKFRGSSTYIKEYFNSKDPASAAYTNASSTILSPNETKGSILAVFKEKIKLFATRVNLSEMLSHSDFDIKKIGTQKTALFIVIQDEKKTYHSLATILVKQIYETLIDVAQAHKGELPVRTNFLLDEFANMPPLKDVTTMITAARSRKMRFTLIIQNFAQLNEVYGEQNAETIKGNCGNLVYLLSTELKALEEISKMCGEVKSKKDDKTSSTPLVTISDLQKLKKFEVIIRRVRLAPFKTKFTPNFKMDWGIKFPIVSIEDIPAREIKELRTFNVKTFVDEKLKKNQNDLLDYAGGGALPMFGGGMPGGFMGGGGSLFGGDSMFNNPSMPKPNNDIDLSDKGLDDLINSINSRIEEIDKQDQAEKNNATNEMEDIINSKEKQEENNNRLDEIINASNETSNESVKTPDNTSNETVNESNTKQELPISNTNNNASNSPNNNTSKKVLDDDEFFDDFFE